VKFSIVIPARDEERHLPACLRSIAEAARPFPAQVETVVVVNRCTDGTERIARDFGARVVKDDSRCIAQLRNAGARAASGEVLVTLDADSVISPNLLSKVGAALEDERVIGGAVNIKLERLSLGLVCTLVAMLPILIALRISGGSFWVRREVFLALGGFDERRRAFEDIDFILRLKRYARAWHKRTRILLGAHIVTSCRKFDRYGDWYLLRHPIKMLSMLLGREDRKFQDELWYDFRR